MAGNIDIEPGAPSEGSSQGDSLAPKREKWRKGATKKPTNTTVLANVAHRYNVVHPHSRPQGRKVGIVAIRITRKPFLRPGRE